MPRQARQANEPCDRRSTWNGRGERYLRFHKDTAHLATPFGANWFGAFAERIARLFGTPMYLIGQSAIVVLWMIVNAIAALRAQWDPYPFILLNLVFSLQAAYAAPLANDLRSGSLVEPRGLEPLTSTLPVLRSPN